MEELHEDNHEETRQVVDALYDKLHQLANRSWIEAWLHPFRDETIRIVSAFPNQFFHYDTQLCWVDQFNPAEDPIVLTVREDVVAFTYDTLREQYYFQYLVHDGLEANHAPEILTQFVAMSFDVITTTDSVWRIIKESILNVWVKAI